VETSILRILSSNNEIPLFWKIDLGAFRQVAIERMFPFSFSIDVLIRFLGQTTWENPFVEYFDPTIRAFFFRRWILDPFTKLP